MAPAVSGTPNPAPPFVGASLGECQLAATTTTSSRCHEVAQSTLAPVTPSPSPAVPPQLRKCTYIVDRQPCYVVPNENPFSISSSDRASTPRIPQTIRPESCTEKPKQNYSPSLPHPRCPSRKHRTLHPLRSIFRQPPAHTHVPPTPPAAPMDVTTTRAVASRLYCLHAPPPVRLPGTYHLSLPTLPISTAPSPSRSQPSQPSQPAPTYLIYVPVPAFP